MATMELFAGGELECFNLIGGAPVVSTSSSFLDPGFSACAIDVNQGLYSQIFRDDLGAAATCSGGERLSVSCMIGNGATNLIGAFITILDTGGRPAIRIAGEVESGAALQHNTSSNTTPVWTTLSSFPSIGLKGYVGFDLVTGSDKSFVFFVGGSIVSSGPLTNTFGPLSSFTIGMQNNSAYISQVIINKDLSATGARLMTRKADGAGSVSGMTGVYTSLVKTSINDSTAITSDTAGQISTFSYQDFTTPTGLIPRGVHLWTRGKNDGTAPNELKGVCRISSTNYASPAMGTVSGFGPLLARFPKNPATSTAWTDATFNSAEFGLESAT